MRALSLGASVVAGMSTALAAAADGDPKRGADVYRACVTCHALERACISAARASAT